MYHEFSRDNPLRKVSWRWERAGLVVDNTLPPSRKRDTDSWVAKAVKFRRRYDACLDQIDFALLSEAEPGIFWAHRLWATDPRNAYEIGLKHELEARLLAECDDEQIEERMGLGPATIEAYEKLFFNVRPKLKHQGYILQRVLGPAVQRGLNGREYDLLWKLYGYMRGVHTLEYAISGWTTKRAHIPEADVGRQWSEDQARELAQQAGVATKSLRINMETQADIVKLYYHLREMERLAGAAVGGQSDAMMAAVATFVQNNNYACGPPGRHERVTKVIEYDNAAFELTSAQLADCAGGGEPGLDPRIISVKFPERKQLTEGQPS